MIEAFENLIMDAAEAAGFVKVVREENTSTIWLDFHAVWASKLPDDSDRQKTLDAVDAMLDKVLQARKSLQAVPSSDLYVMFAAPYGSAKDAEWHSLAAEIERDDRLARKHVWLPNEKGTNFDSFIETTFLARPWSNQNTGDSSSDALELLTSHVPMPFGWKKILLDDKLQGEDLVRKLLSLEMGISS